MYKSVKSKIILISVIIGLILIGSLSFLYLTSISEIQNIISQENNIEEIIQKVSDIYSNAKISISAIIVLFIVMSMLISTFLSRFVICPKNKFIKGDERAELKDKLNEVSSRKNQIETIL